MSGQSADEGPHLLRRAVSGPMLLLLVVGDILGAGIYILVGDVAGEIGGMAWVAFLLAFAVAALSAASYSALVTRFPGPADTVAVPVSWAGEACGGVLQLHATLELSTIEDGSCDLHAVGQCSDGESGSSTAERCRRRVVVSTVRGVLDALRRRLEETVHHSGDPT